MMRYATAEIVLAQMFGAGSDARVKAFRGRLKHLKRLGIPLNSSPGRGSKIWYHDEQVFQWAICLELAEFGLDPTVIVGFVRDHWADLFSKLKDARPAFGQDDLILWITPSLMSCSWSQADGLQYEWLTVSQCRHRIGRGRRALLINASAMVNEMVMALGAR